MAAEDILAQRFVLERELGRGGMGVVYRAYDKWDGSPCAVKVLAATTNMRRFLREAQILSQLAHPAIVRYRGHGLSPNGSLFLAMEWVEGPDLEKRIASRPLSLVDALAVGRRVAEALVAVHAAGVVHRDVKPSNVFLEGGKAEQAKLGDFGIAHVEKTRHASSTLTKTGAIVGTPGYLAPEQIHGQSIGPRTDLFGLGCVLYECLIGRPAFVADSLLGLLAKIALDPTPRLRDERPELPEALDELVATLLAKSAAERPETASDVLTALSRIDASTPSADIRPPDTHVGTGERRLVPVVVCPADGDAFQLSSGDAFQSVQRLDKLDSVPAGRLDSVPVVSREVEVSELRSALSGAAKSAGAHLELLPDGSIIAVLDMNVESPGEQMLRAARLARAIASHVGGRAIAVATGRVVVTNGLPVSEMVERAVAMLREAPLGAIVLDEGSAALLEARFEIQREPTLLLLGTERSDENAKRQLLGKPTPFVGRRRELSLLLTTLEESIEESYARSVLVTGLPGLGKSRLLGELLAEARTRHGDRLRVVMGRGDPVRTGVPFSLVGTAIRRVAKVVGDDSQDERLRKMRGLVARDGEPRDDLVAFLGEIAGLDLPDAIDPRLRAARRDPPMMNALTRDSFVEWATRVTKKSALLLALDDLHWGDGASVALVDAALGALANAPLCVLVLGRPEVRESYPRLFETRDITELKLGRLSKRASEDLVNAVLGDDVDPSLRDVISARAEGNAFFLEELIRAGASGGVTGLPDTVLGVMESRLGELDPDARLILRAASVFGESCWEGGVRSVLGLEGKRSDVSGWLAALSQQEVLVPQLASRFAAEREYVFRHALLRDASYATLPDSDKRAAHERAAHWLEAKGEGAAAVLASHWERAGETDRAVDCYVRAVEQSLRGNDLDAAVSLASKAEACGAAGEPLGRLRLFESEAFTWMGAPERARKAALEAALRLPRGSAAWCTAVAQVIESAALLGAEDDLDTFVAALREPSDESARADRVAALSRSSFALVLLGRSRDAEALLDDASVLAEHVSDPMALAHLAHAHAARAMVGRHRERAAKHYAEAADAFEESGALRLASGARTNVAAMYLELGLAERALEALDRALLLADRTGARYTTALARINRGIALTRLDRADEAVDVLFAAQEELERQGDRRLAASAACAHADALAAAGRLAEAEREAEHALEIAEGVPPARAAAYATLAFVRLERGHLEGALVAAQTGDAERVRTTMEEREVLLDLVLAELLHAKGDTDRARALLRRTSTDLEAQASAIESDEVRSAFLERVPENRRALTLAKILC